MKKLFKVCSLVVMLVGLTAFNASAIPFTGDVSFSGNAVPETASNVITYDFTSATKLTSIAAVISAVDGQYTGIPVLLQVGTPAVTFGNIIYDPVTTPISPLWSFSYLGVNYTFIGTSMIVSDRQANHVDLSGTGIAHIDGFTDSPGTWILTVNSSGSTGSFSASTGVPVPEPTSMLLLGLGLLGLAGIRRKFKSSKS